VSEIKPEAAPPPKESQVRESSQFWSTYWTAALDKWRDTDSRISRLTTLMLGSALLFELIDRNLVSGINFDFVKVSKPTFVMAVIPIVIGYLFFSIGSLTSDLDWISRTYWSSFEKDYEGNDPAHEAWYRTGLVPSCGMFNALVKMDYKSKDKLEATASFGNYFKSFLALLWPPAFEIYSFIELIRRFGISNFLIWGAILIASLLIVFSFIAILSAPSPDHSCGRRAGPGRRLGR
jgi:hypothetical protein